MEAWEAFIQEVRSREGLRFATIEGDFLRMMETMNSAWVAGELEEGVYRQKGNRWRDLIVELVRSRCMVTLQGRRIQGLTDIHAVDSAYPPIGDPVLVVEAKMLGTPAHTMPNGRRKPERGGAVDLDKRLKEVKYTPVDLKLKHTGTTVGEWDQWVKSSLPKFYSLWACYIGERERRNLDAMIRKFQDLKGYYNDGVGVFFYEQSGSRYIKVDDPALLELSIDDVVDEICRLLSGSA